MRFLRRAVVWTAVVGTSAVGLGLTTQAVAGARPRARADGPVAPFTRTFFGMSMGADLTNLPDSKFDFEMNTMRKIGVHWVRAIIPWGLVQPHGPDDAEWTLVDRLVESVQAEGMQLDAIIDNPPLWAGESPPTVPGCTVTPAFDLQAYANFAKLVAQRYTSTMVSAIEVENSPNLAGTWPTPNPCDYARLMKDVYPAVKGVDNKIRVLNGGVGGTRSKRGALSGDKWIAQLYQNGAAGTFDALSFHPYSYPCSPSEGCGTRTWGELSKVRQSMMDNGDGAKKIWATEFGAPTSGVGADGHVTEAQQSSIMVDGMKSWAAFPWAGPFMVYELRDYGTDVADKSDWFGLISNDLKHKKPAFFAYQFEATGKGTPPS
jgi:polysaccharide biosynthesis protein PslG